MIHFCDDAGLGLQTARPARCFRVLDGRLPARQRKLDITITWHGVVRLSWRARHNAWKDFESGIVFSAEQHHLQPVPVDRVAAKAGRGPRPEQGRNHGPVHARTKYFWPFDMNHIPIHPSGVETRFAADARGHKPVFFTKASSGRTPATPRKLAPSLSLADKQEVSELCHATRYRDALVLESARGRRRPLGIAGKLAVAGGDVTGGEDRPTVRRGRL